MMPNFRLFAASTIALLLAMPFALAQQGSQQDENAAPESQTTSEDQPPGGELSDHTVAVIQHNLKRLGFYEGSADGQWSEDVSVALRNFQNSRGLNTDGKVDIESLAALGIIGGMPQMAVMGRGPRSGMAPQRGTMMGRGTVMGGQGSISGQGKGMRGQGSGTSAPGTGQVYRVPPGFILVPDPGHDGS